jgi:hypothetical protein
MIASDQQVWSPSLSRKQSDAWWALQDDFVEEVMYGGAKGGGKSWFGCHWLWHECYEIARNFVPKARKHPIPIAFMGRKVGKHFKETTLDTWKRFIPGDRYRIKGDPAEITIADRVLIRTGGLEAKEDLEKFNSAEFARIFVDQAEETTKDDISVLRASLRLSIGGRAIPPKVLWTANPGQCWLKEEFIDDPVPEKVFIKALPTDNTKMPDLDGYLRRLREAFKHRPELLAAYLEGKWDAFEGGNQLILSRWIDAAYDNESYIPSSGKLVACDPSRFGDDETPIFLMEDTDVKEKVILGKASVVEVANEVTKMTRVNGHCPAVVDEIGIGGGVIDVCRQNGVNVIAFNGAESSEEKEKYYNLRAEAWFRASQDFSERKVRLTLPNTTLRKQLVVPTYSFRNGRILIEEKKDIKKRLGGKSPDWADCYIMGLWARNQAIGRCGMTLGQYRALKAQYGYRTG